MLPEEKWNELERSLKETEKTLTIVFPFQEEGVILSQIYELHPLPKTEALVETKTGVLSPNAVSENVKNETS